MNSVSYDFKDFKNACKKPEKVFIMKKALVDAGQDFNLYSQNELLSFIENGGLEKLVFVNSILWENNQDSQNPMFVDAYRFWSYSRQGYIAFMFNKITKKWIIKSFHLDVYRDTLLQDTLKKALEKKERGIK